METLPTINLFRVTMCVLLFMKFEVQMLGTFLSFFIESE